MANFQDSIISDLEGFVNMRYDDIFGGIDAASASESVNDGGHGNNNNEGVIIERDINDGDFYDDDGNEGVNDNDLYDVDGFYGRDDGANNVRDNNGIFDDPATTSGSANNIGGYAQGSNNNNDTEQNRDDYDEEDNELSDAVSIYERDAEQVRRIHDAIEFQRLLNDTQGLATCDKAYSETAQAVAIKAKAEIDAINHQNMLNADFQIGDASFFEIDQNCQALLAAAAAPAPQEIEPAVVQQTASQVSDLHLLNAVIEAENNIRRITDNNSGEIDQLLDIMDENATNEPRYQDVNTELFDSMINNLNFSDLTNELLNCDFDLLCGDDIGMVLATEIDDLMDIVQVGSGADGADDTNDNALPTNNQLPIKRGRENIDNSAEVIEQPAKRQRHEVKDGSYISSQPTTSRSINSDDAERVSSKRTRETPEPAIESAADGEEDDDTEIFLIESQTVRRYKNLGASGLKIKLRFLNPPDNNDELTGEMVKEWLHRSFTSLLAYVLAVLEIEPQDQVGFKFLSEERESFSISFRRFDQYTADTLLDGLARLIQSNKQFFYSDLFNIECDHVKIPVGCGRRGGSIGLKLQQLPVAYPRSCYLPEIEDLNLCLGYTLYLGKLYADGNATLFARLTHEHQKEDLKAKVLEFCATVGVDLSTGGGLAELRKFQDFLYPNYQITVFNDRTGESVFFRDPLYMGIKKIYLLLENQHYLLIKKLKGIFELRYYCEGCLKRYTNQHYHKNCPYTCPCCYVKTPCKPDRVEKPCTECNRSFRSVVCFNNHLKTTCNKYRICGECYAPYAVRLNQPHTCGEKFCNICNGMRDINHLCYMAPSKKVAKNRNKRSEKILYVFYDFESTQSESYSEIDGASLHKANLCAAQQTCDSCSDSDDISIPCVSCGPRQFTFESENCVESFMQYLTKINRKFNKVIVIAHNMQGYDGHYCLRYMYNNNHSWAIKEDSLVINGTKILKMASGRFLFIDSLNYFMTPLSKLPKMFKLEEVKGYYPHLFNTKENYSYIGPIPEQKYFSPDTMASEKERTEFIKWHTERVESNDEFNNRNELIKYCQLDVTILRLACMQFQKTLYAATGVDPFNGPITIAGTCLEVFKSKHLTAETIGIVPAHGYRGVDNQSTKALQWLSWMAHRFNIKIETAANGRENRLPNGIRVDGYDRANRTVYEFLGCYWHRCEKCFPQQSHLVPGRDDETFSLKRDSDKKRFERIRSSKYQLVLKWECEFDRELKSNNQMRAYINTLHHLTNEPLNPRDAFFGGRTNACKLYHKVEESEKIHYFDVCSLYPYINKYFKYPIKHPKILLGDDLIDKTVHNTEGLFKCRVLPPKKLYHPVLPIKMHNKLLFPLCYTCASEKNNENCTHTDELRAFDGTFVADELRVAVEEGYHILRIYEIWEYETVKYDSDPNNKCDGLFGTYIDFFLKMKTEASGFPAWCRDDTDKDSYIEQYETKEGIKLEKQNIAKNPGFRSLAKLMLNSLWGKLGQRSDRSKKIIVSDRDMFLRYVTDSSLEVESMFELRDDTVLLSYKIKHEAQQPSANVNVALAAYTTANARLVLYSYLKMLGERVLYFDTDSIIFTTKPGEVNPHVGDFLGDLTDEITDDYGAGAFISEFVTGGPKNYAYLVKKPDGEEKTVCKVKGLRLNYITSQSVNFNVIKDLVLSAEQERCVLVRNWMIRRTTDNIIYSKFGTYKYRINATKRRRIGEKGLSTVPYGTTA